METYNKKFMTNKEIQSKLLEESQTQKPKLWNDDDMKIAALTGSGGYFGEIKWFDSVRFNDWLDKYKSTKQENKQS
jgi:hypothetical protein